MTYRNCLLLLPIIVSLLFVSACTKPPGDHRKYTNDSYCAQLAQKIHATEHATHPTRKTAINHAQYMQDYQSHDCHEPFSYDKEGYVD